jgi:hypothetical protein
LVHARLQPFFVSHRFYQAMAEASGGSMHALCLCIDFTKPRLKPSFGSVHWSNTRPLGRGRLL